MQTRLVSYSEKLRRTYRHPMSVAVALGLANYIVSSDGCADNGVSTGWLNSARLWPWTVAKR
jgi:hypothetical protein